MNHPEPFEEKKIIFDQCFIEHVIGDTGLSTSIRKIISKYQLQEYTKLEDVFTECYIRAINTLKSGEEIRSIKPWSRSTCYNVCREKFRERNKRNQTESPLIEELDSNQFSSEELDESISDVERDIIHKIINEMSNLSPLDQKLILLRSEGNSYSEIVSILKRDGDVSDENEINFGILETRYRQRTCRAIKRIREKIEVGG